MVNDLDKRRLRFLVAPTCSPDPLLKKDLDSAYRCWKAVWSHALSEEMNVKERLHSDNFTRHELVAVVFLGDEPVCLATLKPFDLNSEKDLDDTYFKVWSQEALMAVKQNTTNVMASCNATVNFKFRKGQLGISGIDFLCAMLVQYLKSTNYDGIICVPRVQKSVEEACYRTGATLIEKNVPYTIPGQIIDVVCWYKTIDMKKWDPELRDLTEYVWERSTHLVLPLQQGKKYAA